MKEQLKVVQMNLTHEQYQKHVTISAETLRGPHCTERALYALQYVRLSVPFDSSRQTDKQTDRQ